jgi:hypothetical protein
MMVNGRTDSCTVVIVLYYLPVTHDNSNDNNFFLNYVWLVHYFTIFNIHICYRLKIKNINLKIDERVRKFTSYDNPISEKFSGTHPYVLRMQCLIKVDDPVVNRGIPVLDVQVIDIWILCKRLL